MKFEKWAASVLGKGIDFDKAYGVQCVDLVKHYIKNVLEITPQSIGNAIEYYNKRKTSKYLIDNFIWHNNTPKFVPKKGDICVFKTNSGIGHVSISTGEGDTKIFYSLDQNYPKGQHEPTAKIAHNYKNFLGVLRPKNKKNLKELTTKTSYKTEIGKNYKLKKFTALNSKSNFTGKSYGYLKNTTVTILSHYNEKVDKVRVIKTGRIAYIQIENLNL